MTGGSIQLRAYRIARRDGAGMLAACIVSGVSASEARLIEAEDIRNPPAPAAFEPITPAPSCATEEKESPMGRPKKVAGTVNGEVPQPDFALAVKIYREDIKPAQSRVGEFAQEQSTAYKAIKKQAHIQPQAAKAVFALLEMEESKRDDYLRCRAGLEAELGISIRTDLVDLAQGGEKPTARPKPKLVTISAGPADGSDSDLAGEQAEAAE